MGIVDWIVDCVKMIIVDWIEPYNPTEFHNTFYQTIFHNTFQQSFSHFIHFLTLITSGGIASCGQI